jgi:hypothetical protein
MVDRSSATSFSASSGLVAQSRDKARRLGRGETTVTRILLGSVMRQPKRAIGLLVMGGGTVAVMGNLLLMQPEKHAYPMFAGNTVMHAEPQPSTVPLPVVRPGAPTGAPERNSEAIRQAELLRDIQQELGNRGFFAGELDATATARTTQAIREFQTAASMTVTGQPSEALLAAILTSNVKPRDQILGAIRASTSRLERADTVEALQRALTKLNYGPLRADGQFGAGTKAALERFEKDRKLPSHVESPTRVLRELARASGIAID